MDYYEVLCKTCGHKYLANRRVFDLRDIIERYLREASQIEVLEEEYRQFYEHLTKLPSHMNNILAANSKHKNPLFHWALLCRNAELYPEIGTLEQRGTAQDVFNLVICGKDFIQYFSTLFSLPQLSKAADLQKEYNDKLLGNKTERAVETPFLTDIFQNQDKEFLRCRIKVHYTEDDQNNKIPRDLAIIFRRPNAGQIIDMGKEFTYRAVCCPRCFHAISKNSGIHKEYVIGLTGTSGVGKSAYLAALIDMLRQDTVTKKGAGGIGLTDNRIVHHGESDKSFEDFENNYLNAYRKYFAVKKTEKNESLTAIRPLSVTCKVFNKEKPIVLTFVDMPGEAFLDVTRDEDGFLENNEGGYNKANEIEEKYTAFNRADIYWLFLDPSQVSMRTSQFINQLHEASEIEMESTTVNTELLNVLENLHDTMQALLTLRKDENESGYRKSKLLSSAKSDHLMKVGGVFLTKFDMLEGLYAKASEEDNLVYQDNISDEEFKNYCEKNGVHLNSGSGNKNGLIVESILKEDYSRNCSFDLTQFCQSFLLETWNLIKPVSIDPEVYGLIDKIFQCYPLFPVAPYGINPVTPMIPYTMEIKEKGKITITKKIDKEAINRDELSKKVFYSAVSKARQNNIFKRIVKIRNDFEKKKQGNLDEVLDECNMLINELIESIHDDQELVKTMLQSVQSGKIEDPMLESYTPQIIKSTLLANTVEKKINEALEICNMLVSLITEQDKKDILKAYLLLQIDKKALRNETWEKVNKISCPEDAVPGAKSLIPIGIEIPFIWTLYALGILEGIERQEEVHGFLFKKVKEKYVKKSFGQDENSDEKILNSWNRINYR